MGRQDCLLFLMSSLLAMSLSLFALLVGLGRNSQAPQPDEWYSVGSRLGELVHMVKNDTSCQYWGVCLLNMGRNWEPRALGETVAGFVFVAFFFSLEQPSRDDWWKGEEEKYFGDVREGAGCHVPTLPSFRVHRWHQKHPAKLQRGLFGWGNSPPLFLHSTTWACSS